MNSALELVAFSHGCHFSGTTALLETALKALDRSGHALPATYVAMAMDLYVLQAGEDRDRNFEDISEFG